MKSMQAGNTCVSLLAVLLLFSSCSRWIELADDAASRAPHGTVRTILQQEQVPLLLDRVQLIRNGSPQNPSQDTDRRFLGSLREIGLFSRLDSTENIGASTQGKTIHARLVINEAVDPHSGAAAWKGIVIGASMFLLTPVIPLEYDYTSHMTLELERWDGQIKRYEGRSAGTSRFHLFGATPLMIDELKGLVTESCLTVVMEQLVQDSSFYTASSAPLPDNPIRSVSVKPKHSGSPPVPVVPVFTQSGR
ncbi:MAG: hypothetical protein P0111_10695 [Nitrospira sp.]|nr:hypothetical protein [Nitrospira sp.]